MINVENQEIVKTKRALYMDGKISHQDYYIWMAKFINATEAMLPVSKDRLFKSKDEHLNDIPMKLWDNQDYIIRRLAYDKGLAWSLCDTVCVLKALARKIITSG